ncbi:MAG TPA: aspartyl-phosphate phosphatase Spo0E family protein [Ureibacillus sp.]|nr:aspartyl-phosphate phosphatase Spo0E family protein [Ureibacillus sp.]
MGKETISLLELEDIIACLQNRMINIGLSKGLTHPDTVKCSQELDSFLNHFHQISTEQNVYI